MRAFADYHPFVLFIYYAAIISITMFFIHPIILLFSLIGSLLFFSFLTSMKSFLRDIGFYILFFLLIAITNPIFVHKGETILFFLNDNPVTLEAIIYGFFIAAMLVSVIFWSKSYRELMTSDKFIYLFGRVIPKLSLVISMALRFIPTFNAQMKKVNQTQKTLGLYASDSIADRILNGVRTFNSLLTWSMENAITQADSMKARGYGLKGRTSFSLFKWQKRDVFVLSIIAGLIACMMYFNSRNLYRFEFYPAITQLDFSMKDLSHFVFVFILMILPALFEVKENLLWRYLQSRI